MRPELSRWSLGTLSLLLLLEGVRLAGASPTSRGGATPCRQDTLAVYQVTFQTFWDQESFPRQYPEWRPPAQWSKLIGFSHDPSYRLFEVGKLASAAVKEFAETGETEAFDKEARSQDDGGGGGGDEETNQLASASSSSPLFDSFSAPPVESGAGTSRAKLFVDGNHTLISMMSKLVPSPDWFVGLDSLDLCENGRFIDTLTVESDPLDAGTDNGFTFTSPNWPTTPPGLIFRVTNVYPSHPAGSFYYPERSSLPTIAAFTFRKEREYDLAEEFSFDGEEVKHVKKSGGSKNYNYYQVDKDEDDEEAAVIDFVPREEAEFEKEEEEERRMEEAIMSNEIPEAAKPSEEKKHHKNKHHHGHHGRRHHGHHGSALRQSSVKAFRGGGGGGQSSSSGDSGYHASTGPADFFKKKYKSEILEEAQERLYGSGGSGDRSKSLYERLLEKYSAKRRRDGGGGGAGTLGESLAKKLRKRKMRRLRKKKASKTKHRAPRDCQTSEWTDWGPCSKTCGFGEAVRVRRILRHPKRGGKTCPALKDVKWCGSARNCHGRYFDW